MNIKTKIKIINGLYSFLYKIRKNISETLIVLRYKKFTLEFGERDDDIYVATYLKSGTTWMQMILYQLTTDGNTDFNHIYDVSPWVRNCSVTGIPPPYDLPSPRIIKTHDPYDLVPKGTKGRFIFIIRDGKDIATSLYFHRKNYNNPDAKFEQVFKECFIESSEINWFEFTKKWLENKNNHNILYLKYEDLKSDFDGSLERIIQFCNIKVDKSEMPRIKERSGFAFMKIHQDKFGEQPRDKKVYDQFIRKGISGEGLDYLKEPELKIYFKNYQTFLKKFKLGYAEDLFRKKDS